MAAPVLSLVASFPNHIRYLVTGDAAGGTFQLPSAGGASPDLRTDTSAGPLKQIAFAQVNGIGSIPAGALTQAQARALLLSNGGGLPLNDVAGGINTPRAICRFTPASGVATWSVDANQLAGNPSLTITNGASAGAATGYLDIEIPGGIGA